MPSIQIEMKNFKKNDDNDNDERRKKEEKKQRQIKTPESIINAFNQKSQVSLMKRPNKCGAAYVLFLSIYDTFFSLVVATLCKLFSSYSHHMSIQWKTRQIPND